AFASKSETWSQSGASPLVYAANAACGLVCICTVMRVRLGAGQLRWATYLGLGTSVRWSWCAHSDSMNGPFPIYVAGSVAQASGFAATMSDRNGTPIHRAARSGKAANG